MSELPGTARVVIIGGGAVGVSSLYHLARAGWTDCLLLEKTELTAGSTWHAAGNCPTIAGAYGIMQMQRYSTDLYRRLGDAVGYPMNYHVTGSIRLAHGRARMQEFHAAASMARRQGLSYDLLAPGDLKGLYPFLEIHDLAGALWDPVDGDIDPAQLTQALAKGARDLGARIVRFCPATGIARAGDDWIVHTPKGDVRCEIVVNAAGYYAQAVGEWFRPFGGRTVPMAVMSHQYMLTDEVPDIAAWSKENGRKLPLLRDVDTSYYLRQEKAGFNLGPYERNCRAAWVDPGDPVPEDFSFQLFPDDLDRLEDYIEDAMARVPLLGSVGVSRVINGPIPYAPDGLPLIGPMPGVRNAFEACVFTFGIAQAGGAGKVLADWITEGAPEWDMWAVDPRRFTDHTDHDHCVATALQVYGHEYAMHFPWRDWPAGRDRKCSPLHDRIKGLGGVMGSYGGWERANWFAAPGDDRGEAATLTWERAGPWEARVRAECEAVRDGAGVIDLTGFSRFALSGAGAADWLDGRIAGALPREGRLTLGYFPDPQGRIVTEMSILRHGAESFTLITAAAALWHDRDHLLADGLPEGVSLTDETRAMGTLLVTGPEARAVLARAGCDGDLHLPWLSHHEARVAGQGALLVRVSFAGELGWELHAAPSALPAIYEAVLGAGAVPFGMWALNSLRLEKAYRGWKTELSPAYSLVEAGLDRFVRPSKAAAFPGKAALARQRQEGVARRFVPLIVEAGAADAPGMATLWHEGEPVGETTSGGWGYRVGSSIAMAMLRADLTAPGTRIEVDIYGERRGAVVQADRPLWDPDNARLRA